MSQTITQKILASHAGKKEVSPGELINAQIDIALGNDITAPIAIKEFEKIGVGQVFDKERVVLVPDHFTPNKDIKSAEQARMLRDFAKKYGLVNYFEIGRMGIEHALLPEQGLVLPGDLIIGADSHTCTYGALGAFSTGVGSTDLAAVMATGELWFKVPESLKIIFNGKLQKWTTAKDLILFLIGQIGVDGAHYLAMEFTGSTIAQLSIEGRLTMANMAIEAGAKNGIFEADQKTIAYINQAMKTNPASTRKKDWQKGAKIFKSDPDAVYKKVAEFDASQIEPQVSFPHLPENAKPVSQATHIKIDQAVIGSCTNGRIEDLRMAAKVLKGKKVHPEVRCLIIPATQLVYQQMLKEGLAQIFLDAEAAISTPTCGPCLGGHMGILAKGEKAVATTNRNFVGRMGDPGSEVYLASPYVAAASAVMGRIAEPQEV